MPDENSHSFRYNRKGTATDTHVRGCYSTDNDKPKSENGKLELMLATPKQELSLFDSTCIIVGIIIGAGIYETAPTVARCLESETGILAIWLSGWFSGPDGGLVLCRTCHCHSQGRR